MLNTKVNLSQNLLDIQFDLINLLLTVLINKKMSLQYHGIQNHALQGFALIAYEY